MENFEVQKMITQNYSNLYLVKYKLNNLNYILKRVNIYDKEKMNEVKNLILFYENTCCPYITGFYGAFYEKNSVNMIMEYMDIQSLGKI